MARAGDVIGCVLAGTILISAVFFGGNMIEKAANGVVNGVNSIFGRDSEEKTEASHRAEKDSDRHSEHEEATAVRETEYRPPCTEEQKVFRDDRVPHYTGDHPDWTTRTYDWTSHDGRWNMSFTFQLDREMYRYYRGLDRYYKPEEYMHYIYDARNAAVIRQFTDYLRKYAGEMGYDDSDMAWEAVQFVQTVFEYETDPDGRNAVEFPKYPLETIFDGTGDCEDTAILLAALLNDLGFDTGLLYVPDPGHLAVAVRVPDDYTDGAYYDFNNRRYVYIESTSQWKIGDIPGQYLETEATFYQVQPPV